MSDQTPPIPPVPPLPPVPSAAPAASAAATQPTVPYPVTGSAASPYLPAQYAPAHPGPAAYPASYAAPYTAPVSPEYAGVVAPRGSGSVSGTALGVVAFVLALAAAVGATLLSAVAGFAAAEGAMRHALGFTPEGLENVAPRDLLALLTPVRDWVLWAEIGFWAGTALGIWALVQGIVAIAQRRGRPYGIAAVVIAGIGPIVYSTVVYLVILAGIAAGVL